MDLLKYQQAKARGASEQHALSVGDNGIGAPSLGSVKTPSTYGVAVPTSYLRANFGNNPAAWRTARAQITYGGQTVQAPIVDIGPGSKPQRRGVVTDFTDLLAQGLGSGDKAKVSMKLVGNAGPDYTVDPDSFQNEQTQIANQIAAQAKGPMISDQTSDQTMLSGDDLNEAINRAKTADSLA
jgi:hypothetical protein